MSISVCIGNYGYYNEGELRDAWIELPKTQEQIDGFLEEHGLRDAQHEETYISDYDGIPFGLPYGNAFSEFTPLDDLNLLAKRMDDLSEHDIEKLTGAFAAGYETPDSIMEILNIIDQVDELPFFPWPDDLSYKNDEERLGYAIADKLGGIEHLDRKTLESHFDYEGYGRELDHSGFTLGKEGFLDSGIANVRDGLYDAEEIVEEAAARGVDATLGDTPAEAAKRLLSYLAAFEFVGFEADLESDPQLIVAVGSMIEDLDDSEREALSLYSNHASFGLGVEEIGNIVMQVDDIRYHPYAADAGSPHERLGETVVGWDGGISGVPREELERHFDFEAYGRALANNFFMGPGGYFDAVADLPDRNRFSCEELTEAIEERWAASQEAPSAERTQSPIAQAHGIGGPKITGHEPIEKTGYLGHEAYSYPAADNPHGRFAFATKEESQAAMERDFKALDSQLHAFCHDADAPLAFGSPEEQFHAMRTLAAWHGGGEQTPELKDAIWVRELDVKDAMADRGLFWNATRGVIGPMKATDDPGMPSYPAPSRSSVARAKGASR